MKRLVFCILFLEVFLTAEAQEDTTAHVLDSLVITAQRRPQKQSLSPYSVHVLDSRTINEFGKRTTPEALSLVNGVFIQQTNHGGGSPYLRGLIGNQVLILVDGIRLNNSTFRYGPNQYLNTIDPYSIQKIEVAKGTGSVQYGTDAMGGVIQVIIREPDFSSSKNHWSGRAIGKYMTGQMEQTARGEATYSAEKFAAQVGMTYRNFGDLIGGDTTGKQSPSGYEEMSLDAKSKFLLKDNLRLTLSHQNLRQQDVPIYHKVKLENYALNEVHLQQRMLSYAKLDWSTSRKLYKNIVFLTSLQNSREERHNRKNNSDQFNKEEDKVNTLGLTADVFSEYNSWWSSNSGVELFLDKVHSKRSINNSPGGPETIKRGLYPDDARYGNYSMFTMHHFQFNKINAEAGLRYNSFSISLVDSALGKVHIKPSSLVYNLAVNYAVHRNHHFYLSWSTGFRAPNIDDMGTLGIVDFRYELPAADLEAEKSRNLEAGYKFQSERVSANVAAYYMHLENLITRRKMDGEEINGYPVYKKENSEEAFVKGMETELNWNIIKNFQVRGAISYTYGQNITRDEPMRRIPPLNGAMMVKYNKSRWFGAVELLFASRQDRLAKGDEDDNRIPAGGTPGWEVININAGYRWQQVRLNMGLQNLLNRDYRTHGSGINGVGRSAWMSVAFQF